MRLLGPAGLLRGQQRKQAVTPATTTATAAASSREWVIESSICAGADALGERGRPAAQVDARLRAAADLDLAPGEVDAGAERLADRLLGGEPAGVVLGGVRLRVAVGPLGGGEAALAEAVAVALERAADALDLDQVDADPDGRSQVLLEPVRELGDRGDDPVGNDARVLEVVGPELARADEHGAHPGACAPAMSPSRSSPTIQVSSGSASSASIAAAKYCGLGLPSTVASIPAAYSSPATNAPASSRGPSAVCHQRLRCRQ